MATITETLTSVTGYPIPSSVIDTICRLNGLTDSDIWDKEKNECVRAMAQTYLWLVGAPNVSQQGVSYSFSETERSFFKSMAKSLMASIGEDDDAVTGTSYGYKGSRL